MNILHVTYQSTSTNELGVRLLRQLVAQASEHLHVRRKRRVE